VSSRLFAAALVLVALSGCGGKSTPSTGTASSPPLSREGKAVDAWATAAQAYWADFRNCGSRATRTRNFFASCTKQSRQGLARARLKAQAALASAAGSCRTASRQARALVDRTGAGLEGAVRGFDRSNNASLGSGSYGGPPPQQLYFRGAGVLDEGVAKAHTLSRSLSDC
jgi:hypothetical protein